MCCIIAKSKHIYTLPSSLSKRDGYTIHIKCVSVFQQTLQLLEQHSCKQADLIPFYLCPLRQKHHLLSSWKILMASAEIHCIELFLFYQSFDYFTILLTPKTTDFILFFAWNLTKEVNFLVHLT